MAKKAVKKAAKKASKKTKAVNKAVRKKAANKITKKVVKTKATAKIKAKAKVKAKSSSPIIGEVRELVELMVANDLSEIEIQDGQKGISLRRGSLVAAGVEMPAAMPSPAVPAPVAQAAVAAPTAPAAEAPTENLLEVTSPMVGTFYSSSSPDSEPYVAHGSFVSDETVVCIIEAMKVMNEIKADCSGTVVEVCVKNAQPVEFGQVLYKVKPS